MKNENIYTCESCGGKNCDQCGREIKLRDQFAMAALAGFGVGVEPERMAVLCYEVADCMMEARRK